MAKKIKNIGASVRARLLKLSKEQGQSFDLVLTRFAFERLLFRLSQSRFADRFVLKGAMLLMSWLKEPHRGTRDLDLLGFGDPTPDAMLQTFREILTQDADDGVVFDANALRVDRIREEVEYGGLRLRATASISGARINLTIDIGFGDALEPGAEFIDYPVLLDHPAPRLQAYARETVIAEKFQAMVVLGRANSRMKDFYDIWILSRSFSFDDDRLARAIAATFARRGTAIPVDRPDALSPAFAADKLKQQQWRAFLEDAALNPGTLVEVTDDLAAFLIPHAGAAAKLNK
jgi:predicted nucleotidyltransferase component of viral defense system